jgi:hypothetical protein
MGRGFEPPPGHYVSRCMASETMDDARRDAGRLADWSPETGAWILGVFVPFGIREEWRNIQVGGADAPIRTQESTGRLRLTIYADPSICWRRIWRDTPKRPIESILNNFVGGLIIAAGGTRAAQTP